MVLLINEHTCSICNNKIDLKKNPSGLVFNNKHFVCQDCCVHHSEEEINDLCKSVMHSSQNGMPIALWIIHEQNKDKIMMSGKKTTLRTTLK